MYSVDESVSRMHSRRFGFTKPYCGDANEVTTRRKTIPWERCPVCGYRAIPRDGLLIHEAAALFPVALLDCDNPANHPSR
jgi:hypothetical protein